MSAAAAPLSIQLINPDAHVAVRVFLDRKQIYHGTPEPAPGRIRAMLPIVAGVFELTNGTPHALIGEAVGKRIKAQLQWVQRQDASNWIVVRYYPGRTDTAADADEPPFFTFSLQADAVSLK